MLATTSLIFSVFLMFTSEGSEPIINGPKTEIALLRIPMTYTLSRFDKPLKYFKHLGCRENFKQKGQNL